MHKLCRTPPNALVCPGHKPQSMAHNNTAQTIRPHLRLKVGFHYPSSRAELTARELGCIFWHPSTRAVNSGSGNRPLTRCPQWHNGLSSVHPIPLHIHISTATSLSLRQYSRFKVCTSSVTVHVVSTSKYQCSSNGSHQRSPRWLMMWQEVHHIFRTEDLWTSNLVHRQTCPDHQSQRWRSWCHTVHLTGVSP